MILPIEGDARREWTAGTPFVFQGISVDQVSPAFSPDGRWLAYQSNESGRNEIYVRPFPKVDGGRWQVSTDGGSNPRWSATARELLFQSADKIMFAPYTADGAFVPGKQQPWSPIGFSSAYDLHPDGKRLVLAAEDTNNAAAVTDRIVFVSGFFDYLRKNVVGKR